MVGLGFNRVHGCMDAWKPYRDALRTLLQETALQRFKSSASLDVSPKDGKSIIQVHPQSMLKWARVAGR